MDYILIGTSILTTTAIASYMFIRYSPETVRTGILALSTYFKDNMIDYFSPKIEDNGDIKMVSYRYNHKIFKIPVSAVRGRHRIITRVDTIPIKLENPSELFLAIWGPHRNFHGYRITPAMLGYEKIMITTSSGIYTFAEDDILSLAYDLPKPEVRYGVDQHDIIDTQNNDEKMISENGILQKNEVLSENGNDKVVLK